MAKTNSLRPDVSVIAADMRVVGRVHSTSVVTVAGTVLGAVSADDQFRHPKILRNLGVARAPQD